MATIRVGGRRIGVKILGWRTLKSADFDSTQDTGGNSIWEWFAKKLVKEGLYYGFSDRRNRKSGVKFYIMKDTTSEIEDAARIRLIVYEPDAETQDVILLDETYGTLKNASRDDIQKIITTTMEKNVRPGQYIFLECNHSSIVDVSGSTWELGHLLMSR